MFAYINDVIMPNLIQITGFTGTVINTMRREASRKNNYPRVPLRV